MKLIPAIWAATALRGVCTVGATVSAVAQTSESASVTRSGGIPITDLVAMMSKKTGKKFILEPRVQAQVSVVPDPARISYDEFLTVLMVYGLVAVERGDTVMIVPDGSARVMPVPMAVGNEKHPDAEVVTRIIHVRNTPAASLVPILRPLIPQFGHLAANICSNDLILVDRFANVKRLEAIIEAVDKGDPFKPEKCSGPPTAKAAGDG
jgi:type II secretory pathway component GspD/PulD (secretin)